MKVKTADIKAYQKQYREEHKGKIEEFRQSKNAIRKELMEFMRKGKSCIWCGYKEHPEILEFHHVSGIKKGNISEMGRKATPQKIQEEIAKCILICPNCHRWHHWDEIKGSKEKFKI